MKVVISLVVEVDPNFATLGGYTQAQHIAALTDEVEALVGREDFKSPFPSIEVYVSTIKE